MVEKLKFLQFISNSKVPEIVFKTNPEIVLKTLISGRIIAERYVKG